MQFLTAERSISLSRTRGRFGGVVLPNKSRSDLSANFVWAVVKQSIKPISVANLLRNTLIGLCIFTLCYVFFVLNQLPSPQFFDRPAQIYKFQDIRKAGKLFGEKEIDLSKIRLTGFMSNGVANGFAIFEIDGKSSGAIAIGETFGQAYFLKNIDKETVEIVYQGKAYKIQMSSKTTPTKK